MSVSIGFRKLPSGGSHCGECRKSVHAPFPPRCDGFPSWPASQEMGHPYGRFDLSQCVMDGPGVPSDQAPATTMKIVARSSGSFAAITGEPGRFAPQLLAASPET